MMDDWVDFDRIGSQLITKKLTYSDFKPSIPLFHYSNSPAGFMIIIMFERKSNHADVERI